MTTDLKELEVAWQQVDKLLDTSDENSIFEAIERAREIVKSDKTAHIFCRAPLARMQSWLSALAYDTSWSVAGHGVAGQELRDAISKLFADVQMLQKVREKEKVSGNHARELAQQMKKGEGR